ncbi:sulfatase [Pontiella agarivorans]|uniref:Sulfatase n=1 Tax=Pontiella agarivorans TaxID=3038953 RepID=A0ABU5MSF8_9BACT|nr:sulfatase [Pontiella agarivorans]MDZ8117071.1 sulfatase [Pontiella agarivorans]
MVKNRTAAVALSCTVLAFLFSGQAFSGSRPNVLFIAIDDLNACPDRMGGETVVQTPNINRLADRGVFFMNAHCAAPSCGPSRAAVLSGMAPAATGVYSNNQDWRKNSVLKDRPTIPQYFKDQGYEVVGGGKIYHASSFSEIQRAGLFDPKPWDDYFPSRKQQLLEDVIEGHSGRFDWAATEMSPEETGDGKVVAWASEMLAREYDRPLFLAVGIYHPHYPWYTPRKYYDRHPMDQLSLPEIPADDMDDLPPAGQKMGNDHYHKKMVEDGEWEEYVRGYNAAVSFADDMVGRLLTALEKSPHAENTVVVLWSDHGYHNGQKQRWEKYALWEQTTRVPLIFSAPGFKGGLECAEPVSLLDIFPTLNDICGFPAVERLDGESLVPLMQNPGKKTGRAVVITTKYKTHAVRTDRWRYIRYANGDEELYDQKKDPKNFTNLAENPEYAGVKAELSRLLPAYNAPINPTGNWKKKSPELQADHK